LVLEWGFQGLRIELRYSRFDQIQDGGHDMTRQLDKKEDIDKNRAISPFILAIAILDF